ncbi:MAG: metallophosphoesterase family protein [Candidatus Thorarchaeota archaeon]|jgi:DNA repair exonuclease SbcCD nuclease subunit
MRFLYASDLHGKAKNPISRIDDYSCSWLMKIDEIIQISHREKCESVIINGDVFDSYSISNVLIDEFIDRIESQSIIWYIVVGNHDLIGANWENSKASTLAHIFRRSKKIRKLDTLQSKDWMIQGYHYYFGIEERINDEGLNHNLKNQFTIAIPHALLTVKPFFKNVSQVIAKDLQTNYDLILCGHLHTKFDKTIKGTRFLNLSSIGRTAINEQHQPEVAIISTETREIKKIELKSAKPVNEIFDLSKYEELKKQKKSIDEFIKDLNSAEWTQLDILGQIEKFAKENKFEKKIVDYILEKVRKRDE